MIVQDLATQWLLAYPCKTRTSQETDKSLHKIFEQIASSKEIKKTIRWVLATPVKIFSGIIAHQHATVPRQNGTALREVRREQEGTSAILLQSGLVTKWWTDSLEC